MNTKRVTRELLDAWVNALMEEQTVYAVQAKEDRFAFGALARASDLRLDYDVTILPPRKYFLPQKEDLMTFNRKTVEFKSVIDETPFVLFGVHPYDFVAIAQLDEIFAQGNYDTHYMARRKNAIVVVSDVQRVSSDNFAGCMGNATLPHRKDFEVLVTLLPDGTYVVEPRNRKGVACMAPLAEAPDADTDVLRMREDVWEANRAAMRKHELKMKPSAIPALLDKSHDHPVWAEKAEHCYSCGSCNLVCPTCYCFTVEDELDWDMENGRRQRRWDGCMLAEFAAVAGGHNFREKRTARYRHRYYRKGKYVWDNIDEIACVGCGRCITACTAGIANPVEVFNRLLEDN